MASPPLPHYAWPLQFVTNPDGTVGFAANDQDTPEDLEATAAVIVCTPRGWRDDDAQFGITPLIFEPVPVDAQLIADQVVQSDDRLKLTATEVAGVVDTVRNATLTVLVPTDA